MSLELFIALLGGFVTLLTAIYTNYLSRQRELKLHELQFKLDRYKEFLAGFAEIGSGYKSYEAHLKVANAVNTINLIASSDVLHNVYGLLDYISGHRGADYSVADQDAIVRRIIVSIRNDLGQTVGGDLKGFPYRTISPGIRPGQAVEQ